MLSSPRSGAGGRRSVAVMTLDIPAPPVPGVHARRGAEGAIRWTSPARDLWVATRLGEYAGVVERIEGEYFARDGRGSLLGRFADLGHAQGSLAR